MRLPRTALNMEYIALMSVLLVLCWEMSLHALVIGGDVLSPSGYLWKTSSWGKCQGAQCGFGGTQSRVKWCEHSEGWTASESDCDLLSMPESERTCFKVCAHHADLFEWQVEEWGPCEQNSVLDIVLEPPSSRDVTCGEDSLGVQFRTVKCVEKSTSYVQRPHEDFVDSEVCRELHLEPVTSQECITPCAQGCVVTHFTPWRECTSTCGNGTQTRTRQVVIPPSRGGAKCPQLSETQICDGIPSCDGVQEYTYSIKIGPWSECVRFQEDPDVVLGAQGLPLIGMQNRELWCIRNDGAEVKLKKCFAAGELAIVPNKYQACVIAQDCAISEWSEWSPCPNACPLPYGSEERPTTYRIRRRQVVALPLSDGDLCPELEEREPCRIEEGSATDTYDCPRYTWYTGEWSGCSVAAVMSQHQQLQYSNNRTLCGGGLHRRDLFCIRVNDTDLIPVSDELCESVAKPVSSDKCNVECPKDCRVTGWGPWSECKTTSCTTQSYKREKGHKIRTRDVIVQADIGGRLCPPLAEFVPCDIHICFEWQTTPVGDDCILHSSSECGPGVRQIDITCVGPDKEPVSDNLCTGILLDKPAAEQPCHVPCPDDCVLSHWSDWSECSQSCGKGGTQTRRRPILGRPKLGALACPPDDELLETRMCNSHSCVVFAWLESEWTQCQSVNSAPYHIPNHLIEGITCGIGRQTRTLNCVRVGNFKDSPPKRCSDLNKPAISQQCHIPCPVDCVVSAYGEWDACPEMCPQGKDDLTHSRQRYILTHPSNGGTPCPSLVDTQKCLKKEYCHQYEWLPSNWGLCKPVSGDDGQPRMNEEEQECGFGLKTRELHCQRSDGLPVSNVDLCLRYSDPIPTSSQPCHLPCDEDCNISKWGRWSECPYNCKGEQIRTRKIKGKSRRKPLCANQPTAETRPCVCPSYTLIHLGLESDCILDKKSSMANGDCGKGLSYRAQVCQDQDEMIMPFSYCNTDNEFVGSICDDIKCPYDCNISPWSHWSECSQLEGIGEKIRRRQIITQPVNGGRPCPAHEGDGWLYESKPCQVFNASEVGYYWNAEKWQECRLDVTTAAPNATCGFGFQRRTVRCIMKSPAGFMGWTNHTMCDIEPKPEDIRECRKPCSGECVVGEWAEWSNCPVNCNQMSFRHRTREIVRHPLQAEEDLCPALMEQEQCMININCYDYDWNVTKWSTCELKPGAVCGEGTMIRLLQCKEANGAGNFVDTSICEKRLGPYTRALEVQCLVRCPIDCLLSQWSDWTKCSDVCGPDVGQSRTRKVLRDRTGLGRPCSTKLQQWRPCKVMPCFQLVKSEWSDCITLDGDCGVGLRVRNVTCVQNDGIAVEDKYCLGNIPYSSNINVTVIGAVRLERKQICTIPCPGECRHTQWSSWSKCHIYCYEGRPIGSEGIEARSKAALESYQGVECPGDMVDTRECSGTHISAECTIFSWQTGSWNMGHRDVWCQRSNELSPSNQLNVTGGCPLDEKPNSEAECNQECLVAHSYCSQTAGTCLCMEGYRTKYSQTTGELQECEETVLMEDPSLSDNNIGTSPTYKNADGSGDDTKDDNLLENKIPADSETESKTNQGKSEANKNVFGHIPVWAFAIGGVFIVFILCLVIAFCCACQSCRKKEDTKKPKENPDDFAIYWDETAKKRYNGEVDL